jgi:hypothetical protein
MCVPCSFRLTAACYTFKIKLLRVEDAATADAKLLGNGVVELMRGTGGTVLPDVLASATAGDANRSIAQLQQRLAGAGDVPLPRNVSAFAAVDTESGAVLYHKNLPRYLVTHYLPNVLSAYVQRALMYTQLTRPATGAHAPVCACVCAWPADVHHTA